MKEQLKSALKADLITFADGKKSLLLLGDSYEEVQDSIKDVLSLILIVEKYLKDGLQLVDIFGLLEAQPLVNELIQDFNKFMGQFGNLIPESAIAAVLGAKAELEASGKVFGKVSYAVVSFLYSAARSFEFATNAYEAGREQYLMYQTLFSGGDVFAEE